MHAIIVHIESMDFQMSILLMVVCLVEIGAQKLPTVLQLLNIFPCTGDTKNTDLFTLLCACPCIYRSIRVRKIFCNEMQCKLK